MNRKLIFVALMLLLAAGAQAQPQANFENVWLEHNVWENGVKGLKIHARFTVNNHLNVPCLLTSHFYYANGQALKDFDGQYKDVDGYVSINRDFVPAYPSARFNDLTLFMPYDQLHMASGNTDLSFELGIYTEGRYLTKSNRVTFNYNKT
ncbi:MAG: hypothetical protein AB7S38_06530 [Vulcanimicrobiota bacterium]